MKERRSGLSTKLKIALSLGLIVLLIPLESNARRHAGLEAHVLRRPGSGHQRISTPMKMRCLLMIGAGLLIAARAAAVDLNELRSKAEQGDAQAQYQLGMIYDAGREVQEDLSLAAHLCMKAAEQGHAAAQKERRRAA